MVSQLERSRAGLGRRRAVLTSTATAHRFYLSAGDLDDGPPKPWSGGNVHPMAKALG